MPYSITTYSGAPVATVQDATINSSSTALTLIGRDYAGYGAFLNENFVHLLENFAANTAPTQRLTGQIWYDTSVNTLKVWNTSLNQWKPISSSIAQDSAPSGGTSTVGDLWFDTQNNQLSVYNGGWQLIGPSVTSGTSGTSGPVVEVIKDSSDIDHTVTKFYNDGDVIAIISSDPVFTPKNSINGFALVYPGLNLVSSSAITAAQFTGDTSNALKLNGVTASQFLRADQDTVSPYQVTIGNLKIGTAFAITANSAASEVAASTLLNGYNFNIYANIAGFANTRIVGINGTTGAVTIDRATAVGSTLAVTGAFTANSTTTLVGVTTLQDNMLPNTNGTINIGTNTRRFGNVFANVIVGGTIQGNIVANVLTIGNVTITGSSAALNGNAFATQTWVTSYVNTQGSNSQGTKYISTSPPSGVGTNGDIWYQV